MFEPSSKSKPIRKNETKRVPQRDSSVPRITGPVSFSKFMDGAPDWDADVNEPATLRVVSNNPKDQPGYAGKCFKGRWPVEEYERRQRPRTTRGRFMQGLDYNRRYRDA